MTERYALARDVAALYEDFDPYGFGDSVPDGMTTAEAIEAAALETADDPAALESTLEALECMAADGRPGDLEKVQALKERFNILWRN